MIDQLIINGLNIERKTNNFSVKKENTNNRLCNITILSNNKYRVLTRSEYVNNLAPKGVLIKTTYYKERGYRKYYFDLTYTELTDFLNKLSNFDSKKRIKYEDEYKEITQQTNDATNKNSIIKINKINNFEFGTNELLELESPNSLIEQSNFVYDWLINKKEKDNNISNIYLKNSYGITYKRFNTLILDSVIPDSNVANSAWGTVKFYYYELVIKNSKLYLQLACNYNDNISPEIESVYIDKVLPQIGHNLNEKRKYYKYLFGEKMHITNATSKNEIDNYLDSCYIKLCSLESKFK